MMTLAPMQKMDVLAGIFNLSQAAEGYCSRGVVRAAWVEAEDRRVAVRRWSHAVSVVERAVGGQA